MMCECGSSIVDKVLCDTQAQMYSTVAHSGLCHVLPRPGPQTNLLSVPTIQWN